MDRTRIIQLKGKEIALTPDSKWDLKYTNFPTDIFSFHEGKPFYWLIEIEKYDAENGIVEVKVIDYAPSDISAFNKQLLKRPIKRINFNKLEWSNLQAFLAIYRRKDLNHLLKNESEGLSTDKENSHKTISFDFTISFHDAEFKLGHVSVSKYFNLFDQVLELKIYNSDIVPEYQYIRKFFPKALNGKEKFNVHTKIAYSQREIIEIESSSPEIEAINDEIIDSVKLHRSLQLSRISPETQIDKSLFTSEELTTPLDDIDSNGNAYQQDAQDILNCLLISKDVRNKKQLEYLATHQQSPDHKIRFTLQPNFGFLFFIVGSRKNHYCWELLDSHATYLWSFKKAKNKSRQIRQIEETISLIDEIGRNRYKSSVRNHKLDMNESFNVIPHYAANSPLVDGFVYWKRKLKAHLT